MKSKLNLIIVILAVLLVIILMLLCGTFIYDRVYEPPSPTVRLPNNIAVSDKESNRAFKVENLFPGDSETERYSVRVSHNGDVTLRFRAEVLPGYEKLAEVLKLRVILTDTGEVLYDGLMRDMPYSVNCELNAQTRTISDVGFTISAYLDTDVGNEYMNNSLAADFKWWIEEAGTSVNTEDDGSSSIFSYFYIPAWIIMISAPLLLLLLLRRIKKGGMSGE